MKIDSLVRLLLLGAIAVIAGSCSATHPRVNTSAANLLSADEAAAEAAERSITSHPRASIAYVRRILRGFDVDAMNEALPVVWILGEQAAPLVPELIDTLRHGGHGSRYGSCELPDALLRENASIALGYIGRAAVAPLIQLLDAAQDPSMIDRKVLVHTVRALGRIGEAAQPAVSRLRTLSTSPLPSTDSDLDIAREAREAIANIHPDS